MEHIELGFFGNIWVRQNILEKKGNETQGHYHLFDHVSLLAQGSVLVEIDGIKSKQFDAPTFIVIKKEFSHKFIAMTDNVLWYCVFAIRDIDGDISDIIPDTNSPFFINSVGDSYWQQRYKLENLSLDIDDKPYLSWIWDTNKKIWKSPTPYPNDGKLYQWDENTLSWKLINI